MAKKLNEPIADWHKDIAEAWVDSFDKFDDEWELEPEEAVTEELSCWGE